MQVILHSDIGKVGKKHDIVEVSDGYARNYLIPRKLAELATPERVTQVKRSRAAREAAEAEVNEELQSKLAGLDENGVQVEAPANDQGHLFAGLHTTEIAERVSEAVGVGVSADAVLMDDTIKETGLHTIAIRVGDERVDVPISVTATAPAQKKA